MNSGASIVHPFYSTNSGACFTINVNSGACSTVPVEPVRFNPFFKAKNALNQVRLSKIKNIFLFLIVFYSKNLVLNIISYMMELWIV
jgi:hypothetical protein